MTSVAPATPSATRTSAAARLSVRIWSIARGEVGVAVRPWRWPLTRSPVPSRFVRSSGSPGPRAALPQQPVRMRRADHRQPVLRLGVADRVAAGERAAGLADLVGGAVEHGGEHVPRQLLGERRDRQREQDPAAHREHVAQRVRRRDLAERPGVVDERREEVERADDREVVADPVGGRVVGRREPGDQLVRLGPRRRRARSARRRAGRRRAWRRSRRSRSARSGGTAAARGVRSWSMIGGRRAAGSTLPRATIGRERRGPGGSPGLQNRWRCARRGAVGSTPMRSRRQAQSNVMTRPKRGRSATRRYRCVRGRAGGRWIPLFCGHRGAVSVGPIGGADQVRRLCYF